MGGGQVLPVCHRELLINVFLTDYFSTTHLFVVMSQPQWLRSFNLVNNGLETWCESGSALAIIEKLLIARWTVS